MKEIPLTRGLVAVVSTRDYARVSKFKWHAVKHRKTWYAARGVRTGSKVKSVKMHRFILDAPRDRDVDHRNLNGLINTRCNIRLCANTENALNKGKLVGVEKSFTSRFKGVSLREGSDTKWRASINVNGRRTRLGTFVTEKQAALAYNKAAIKLHGVFARINKI